MKTEVLLAMCLLLINTSFSQNNLVLNPSFEIKGKGQINSRLDSLRYVFNPTDGSVDYHTTINYGSWTLPNSYSGYQWPRTGKAMVGIITIYDGYHTNWPDRSSLLIGTETYSWGLNQKREYVGMQLSEPLKKDFEYRCSFYVNLANINTTRFCHNIGAFFSIEKIDIGCKCIDTWWLTPELVQNYRLDYTPQVENMRAQQELTDTLGWQKIEGSFIAQGGEQYVILGNFRNYYNSEIDDTPWRNNPFATNHPEDEMSYYFIDDVSVVEVGSTVGIVEQAQSKNVFYNNSTNTLNVSERGILVIYNMQGVKVKECLVVSGEELSVGVDDLGGASGVYVWQLQTDKEVQRGKFVAAPSNSP